MAPPGFGPPGYSVPQRYMHREPPPEGSDTNTRPYAIFFSYLLTCLSVAVLIILRLFKRANVLQKSTTAQLPSRSHVWLFSGLALGSLLTTWTYMFQYFKVSYQSWLMWRSYYELEPHHKHWGLWLKETSLFREAWETVIVGNARYWWSHQIFFFALGLGLYLEQKGKTDLIYSRIAITNEHRYSTWDQIYLGIHAAWPDSSHQLCHKPLLTHLASKPTYTCSVVVIRSTSANMARSLATEPLCRICNSVSGDATGR